VATDAEKDHVGHTPSASGGETDGVNEDDILPDATVMAVSVTPADSRKTVQGAVGELHPVAGIQEALEGQLKSVVPKSQARRLTAWAAYVKVALSVKLGPQGVQYVPGLDPRGFVCLCGLVFIFEFLRVYAWLLIPDSERESMVISQEQLQLFPRD
jgi:hypothetical protein